MNFDAIDGALDAAFREAKPRLGELLSDCACIDLDPLLPALRSLAIAAFDAAAGVAVADSGFDTEQEFLDFLNGRLAKRIAWRILPVHGRRAVKKSYGAVLATLRDNFVFGHEFLDDGTEVHFIVPKDARSEDEEQRRPAPPAVHALYQRQGEWEKLAPAGVCYALRVHLPRARSVIIDTINNRAPLWAAHWTLGAANAVLRPTDGVIVTPAQDNAEGRDEPSVVAAPPSRELVLNRQAALKRYRGDQGLDTDQFAQQFEVTPAVIRGVVRGDYSHGGRGLEAKILKKTGIAEVVWFGQ